MTAATIPYSISETWWMLFIVIIGIVYVVGGIIANSKSKKK